MKALFLAFLFSSLAQALVENNSDVEVVIRYDAAGGAEVGGGFSAKLKPGETYEPRFVTFKKGDQISVAGGDNQFISCDFNEEVDSTMASVKIRNSKSPKSLVSKAFKGEPKIKCEAGLHELWK